MQLVLGVAIEFDLRRPWHRSGPVFGDLRLAPYRLGQQAFKAVVADACQWRCAVAGSKIRPALQTAHVLPVKRSLWRRAPPRQRPAAPLRRARDVRSRLRGALILTYRLRVSPRLRSEFGNGDSFYAKARGSRRTARAASRAAESGILAVAPGRRIRGCLKESTIAT